MTSEREFIRMRVAGLLGGRPVHWADERTSRGDFDGREWTLDLFDVAHEEQREAHARLWKLKRLLWEKMRISLTFIFHSPADTDRLYPWVRIVASPRLVDSAYPGRPRVEVERLAGRGGSRRDRPLLPPKPVKVAPCT
jgi:hypothetical protein